MQENILKLAKSHLKEIKKSQGYFSTQIELDCTKRLHDILTSTDTQDYDKIIKAFRKARAAIAVSYYLYIFSQANCFFVKKCDEFIRLAIDEINNTKSPLYHLPDELLLHIFSFLTEYQIKNLPFTCVKFRKLINDDKLELARPIVPLLDLSKRNTSCTSLKINSNAAIHTIVSINEKIIVYSSGQDIILVNHTQPENHKRVLYGHQDDVRAMVYDPKKQLLFSGGEDRTIRVWHLPTGKCIKKLNSIGKIYCLDYYKNKIVCGIDGGFERWDLSNDTSRSLFNVPACLDQVFMTQINFIPGTNKFISLINYEDTNRQAEIWDTDTFECLWDCSNVKRFVIHPLTNNVIVLSQAELFVLDSNTLEIIRWNPYEEDVSDMKMHTNGTLLTISCTGIFSEHNIENFKKISSNQLMLNQEKIELIPHFCIEVNKNNGQVFIATFRSILKLNFSLKNTNHLLTSLNGLLKKFGLPENYNWKFNLEKNIFWIRVGRNHISNLVSLLDFLKLTGNYEIKKVIASDDRCFLFSANHSFKCEMFPNSEIKPGNRL